MKTAWVAGAGALAAGLKAPAWAAPVGANEAVRLGIIGCGAKAQAHIKQLMMRKDVRVVALCDVDPKQMAKAQAGLKAGPRRRLRARMRGRCWRARMWTRCSS